MESKRATIAGPARPDSYKFETGIPKRHILVAKNKNRARNGHGQQWNVNHEFLQCDDFGEFIQAWDAVMHLCPRFPAFVDYLPCEGRLSFELSRYLTALVDYAHSQGKRPVLCEI